MSEATNGTRRRTWSGEAVDGLCGVLAAASGLAAAQLVASVVRPESAPILAVGDAIVELTPGPVVRWAIDTFGTADKPLLIAGIGVVLLVGTALIGVAARRQPRLAALGAGALVAVGLVAVLSRPDAGLADALPTLLGGAIAVGVLVGLLRLSEPRPVAPTGGSIRETQLDGGFDRRRFVLAATATALASAGGGFAASRRGGTSAEAARSRNAIRLPRPSSPAGPLPAGADLEVDGLSSYVTPNDVFYRIDTALTVPQVDATTWRLRLHGLGVEEREYTFQQLLNRFDLVERYVTLACVSNPVGGSLVGNARWIGVPLATVLREAGARPPSEGGPADQLVSRSADGMTIGTPVEDVLDGRDAMLALGMNGEPLPPSHGFPVRVVVPGLYGYVSACKWLVDLELSTFDAYDAYWVPRGWAERAPIKTQSRIDTPGGGSVSRGRASIAGVAWAQTRGIETVEVRVDDGPWREARLSEVRTADSWRQWVLDWDAEPGDHRIQVRATDATGTTQTGEQADPAPDGATGWHTIDVTVT